MYDCIEKQDYSYYPFKGKEFLKDYKKSRMQIRKKQIVKDVEIDSEATKSKHFLIDYAENRNLKVLNSALKINDKLCSKTTTTKKAQNAIFYELELIFKLLEKEKIKL